MAADLSDRLLRAITDLDGVAEQASPAQAARLMEESALQVFWREWPSVSSWAGSLWRLLNEDIADPATSPRDDFDEVGGGD